MFIEAQPLFVGTYTSTESKGIYVLDFNSKDGTLKLLNHHFISNPSYLTVSKKQQKVYVVSEDGNDKPPHVHVLQLDTSTYSLKAIQSVESGGDHPCSITLDKNENYLAVANYSGGNGKVFALSSGVIQKELVQLKGGSGSIHPQRQKTAHLHQVYFDTKNRLWVTDLGSDEVVVYQSDDFHKKLFSFNIQSGGGPRHLELNKGANRAYVLEELSGYISVFVEEQQVWKLKQRIISDRKSDSLKAGSADIHLSDDGRFLYTSNRGDANTISVFKVLPNGLLHWIEDVSAGGLKPRSFVLDPSNKWLIVANQSSNNLVVFKRELKTGKLKITDSVFQLPLPVCVRF